MRMRLSSQVSGATACRGKELVQGKRGLKKLGRRIGCGASVGWSVGRRIECGAIGWSVARLGLGLQF